MPEPAIPSGGRRLAGLDGIRAFAVLGVMGVHQEFGWLPGGFYGVDAFFVLSGFLITSLLVAEVGRTGTIKLPAFWARRARRLLPALLLMVTVVGLVAAFAPSVLGAPTLGGTVATLFFSANWYFAAQHVNYFAIFAQPSPLLPTWSLAIEEQFYLVWPLVLLAVLTWRRGTTGVGRRRLGALLALAIAGAGVSALFMARVSPNGGDPSRAYYGTDTRAQAILVGAALALALALWGTPRRHFVRVAVGIGGAAGVATTAALWHWVPETASLAFHGGFLLAAVAAAAVVLSVVTAERGILARVLSVWPLAKLGRISYGVYLWYWPVLLVVDGERTHLGPYALFGVRLAVTVGIATASFVLVERPILEGALSRRRTAVLLPLALCAAVLATGLAVVVPSGGAPPALAASADHTGVKILLVGDSAAGSLGVGMADVAAHDGAQLVNDASPGCSVSMDQKFKALWYTVDPGPPCRDGHPQALLDRWRTAVDHYNPDVVVYLARGDILDQEIDGRWEHIGEPSFDAHLTQRLQNAVSVLGARGATVVLLTQPAYETAETPSTPWPEDRPERVVDYDHIVHRLAAADGRRVAVVNLGAIVSPDNRFTAAVGGTTTRCTDGVHFTAAGGELVARHILPRLVALGSAHHRDSPGGRWPGTIPPAVPSWWLRLPCQS